MDIYYFSGTGNTLLVARKLVEVFQKRGMDVQLFKMEKSDPARIDISHNIGLAFPVAVQSTFPLVWEFIEKLPPGRSTGIFMVDTLAGFSGGVVGPLRRLLVRKGYRPLGAVEIIMPRNFYPARLDPDKNERKKQSGLKKAEEFALAIVNGTARWGRIPIISDLICKLSRSGKVVNFLRKKGSKFRINETACTRCGSCFKLCPVENIVLEDGEYPVFLDQCQQCMRCISFCPTGAIIVSGKKYQVYRGVKLGEMVRTDLGSYQYPGPEQSI